MEVTFSSLAHPKQIHRNLLNAQLDIEELDVIVVLAEDKSGPASQALAQDIISTISREILVEGTMAMRCIASPTFLLHDAFLLLLEQNPVALQARCKDELWGRFQLDLLPTGKMVLSVDKPLYERLGLQDRKGRRREGRFFIEFDLRSSAVRPGKKMRSRLITALELVLPSEMPFLLTSTSSIAPQLQAILDSQRIPWERLEMKYYQHPPSILPLPMDFGPSAQPNDATLEEWCLWLGCITSSVHLPFAVRPPDPFLAVCRLEGHASQLQRCSIHSPAPLIPSRIAALLESALYMISQNYQLTSHVICIREKCHTSIMPFSIILCGRNRLSPTAPSGFAIFINPNYTFTFCNIHPYTIK